jgi:hypothetical protein
VTKEEKNTIILQKALKDFDRIQSALRGERLQCLQDRRFYSIDGAQWEGDLGEQFENKPKLEVNKIHLSVIRIFSEYRNNRITVDYISKDGKTDNELSDICDGLFRADERDSVAQEAYDNSFEEGVGGGMGAMRLRAEYEDEEDDENEQQRIRIEPIYDADSSVFFDLDAKRQDKADAKYCFVLSSMTHDAYEEEWGESPTSVNKEIGQVEYDWYTPDIVYIAEYYLIEKKKETVYIYKNIAGDEEKYTETDFEENEKLREELLVTGYEEIKSKKVTRRKVHKYIISGNSILEDCGHIAGKNIPIVPSYGKRWFIDNVERCMGHVRLAKDMQRVKNMQISKLAEISALSSVEKPVFTPEQMAGHQLLWSEDNIKNNPYLLINAITDATGNPMPAGPVAYTKPPIIPPAMAALLQLTDSDMKELLGNQQEGDKMASNISGKAVEMIQSRLDMQTFIYMDNFAKAIKRVGEIWLSMAKDVYVEPGRKMKTIGKTEEIGTVELMKPTMKDGEISTENDLSKASFDVAVDVGPSSSSRKESIVRTITGMLQITKDPETAAVLQSFALMNMEGEGIADIREYSRKKLVGMGVIKPTDEELEAMKANAQPTPQDKALEAMANEADANATKARADVAETMADVQKKQAETEKIIAQTETEKLEQIKTLVTPVQ